MTTLELINALKLNFDQSMMLLDHIESLNKVATMRKTRSDAANLMDAITTGPLSTGKAVTSQTLHQYSRAWRKLIAKLNAGNDAAETKLIELGVQRFKKGCATMFIKKA